MSPFFQSAVTVACAIGSWLVAGWVTVSVIKAKMEDIIRRIEYGERRLDVLTNEFNEFRLRTVRDIEGLRRYGKD